MLIYTDPTDFCIEITTTQGNPYPDVGPGAGCFTDPFYYTLPPFWSQNVFFGPGGGSGGIGGAPPIYHVPVQIPPPSPPIEEEKSFVEKACEYANENEESTVGALADAAGLNDSLVQLIDTAAKHTSIDGFAGEAASITGTVATGLASADIASQIHKG